MAEPCRPPYPIFWGDNSVGWCCARCGKEELGFEYDYPPACCPSEWVVGSDAEVVRRIAEFIRREQYEFVPSEREEVVEKLLQIASKLEGSESIE